MDIISMLNKKDSIKFELIKQKLKENLRFKIIVISKDQQEIFFVTENNKVYYGDENEKRRLEKLISKISKASEDRTVFLSSWQASISGLKSKEKGSINLDDFIQELNQENLDIYLYEPQIKDLS